MILIVDNQPAKAELLRHEFAALQVAASENMYVFATAHQCRKWLTRLLERAWGQPWTLFPPHGEGVVIISDLNVSTYTPFFRRKEQRRDNLRDLQHIRRRLGVKAHMLIYTHHPVTTWGDAARAAGADAFVVKGECTAAQIIATVQRLQWQHDQLRSKGWQIVCQDRSSSTHYPQSPQFSHYIDAVMRRATYKQLDDGTYFGSLPGYIGIYHNTATLEDCRMLVRRTLEAVIEDRVNSGRWVPIVNGINVNQRPIEWRERLEQCFFGALAR